jgi:predicted DsbA family dithiol-disulfide isomerase
VIASERGLDAKEIETQLAGDAALYEIEAEATWAREQGVSGVPLFMIDGKLAVYDAQPATTILAALKQVATTEILAAD